MDYGKWRLLWLSKAFSSSPQPCSLNSFAVSWILPPPCPSVWAIARTSPFMSSQLRSTGNIKKHSKRPKSTFASFNSLHWFVPPVLKRIFRSDLLFSPPQQSWTPPERWPNESWAHWQKIAASIERNSCMNIQNGSTGGRFPSFFKFNVVSRVF